MTLTSHRDDLMPCPFCGSDKVSHEFSRDTGGELYSFVLCHHCTMACSPSENTVETWNTRTFTHLEKTHAKQAGASHDDARGEGGN